MLHFSLQLPVEDALPELLRQLGEQNTVLLNAPPGAGKSTLVPLALLDEPWLKNKRIIMLEPRRIAARSVATRMAEILNEQPGKTVGYRIRFESAESEKTKILVVTEGILVRMLHDDPSIAETGLVIFDEFHERSLQADLSLLLTLESRKIFRKDLKVLLMSATLQSEKLSAFLNAPIVNSSGRQHPITFRYLGGDAAVPVIRQITVAVLTALHETHGDILVFLPGTGEILRTAHALEEQSLPALICPLYGELPFQKQKQAILPDPQGRRRVILATSVAETSLTIEGVSTVIDSGLARVPRFDPQSGLTRLVTVPVTADAAVQRAGRAGRLGPGICYRLWEEKQTTHLVPERKPEILEADLSALVLDLLNWGLTDLFSLNWIDTPPHGHIRQALDLLKLLDAVDDSGRLTNKGRKMADLPLHPRLSHMLLSAEHDHQLKSLACDVAAVLEERDPLGRNVGSNLWLRLKELKRYRDKERTLADRGVLERIEKLAKSWRRLSGISSDYTTWPEIPEHYCGALVAAAYPDRIGRQIERQGNRYRLASGRILKFESSDPIVYAEWVVVANADAGAGEGKIFLAAPIEVEQIPGAPFEKSIVTWDPTSEQIVCQTERWKGPVLLSRKSVPDAGQGDHSFMLMEKIREHGLVWAGVGEETIRLLARLQCLHLWRNDEDWLAHSEKALLSRLEQWLMPFLPGIRSRSMLQRLDWNMMILSPFEHRRRQQIEELVPDRIGVPSGSSLIIHYFDDGRPPELHVRLQEVFGWTTTPVVNGGRMPLMMHLLSPAYRPVQITRDLHSFWTTAYHEVRKELRSRYPKHSWPEDPFTAIAVRGIKRK